MQTISIGGRPRMPEGKRKDTNVVIRVRSATKEEWRQAAERAGIYLQTWVENACADSLKRELRRTLRHSKAD